VNSRHRITFLLKGGLGKVTIFFETQ